MKIRFRDLSTALKLAVIGGMIGFIYFCLLIILFFFGFIAGMFLAI